MIKNLAWIFRRYTNKLFTIEDSEQITPKFSYAVKDLAKYFEVYEQKIPLSIMSDNSSEKSAKTITGSKELRDSSVLKLSNSLKTIKESLGKKNISKPKYKHQSSIKHRKTRRSSK